MILFLLRFRCRRWRWVSSYPLHIYISQRIKGILSNDWIELVFLPFLRNFSSIFTYSTHFQRVILSMTTLASTASSLMSSKILLVSRLFSFIKANLWFWIDLDKIFLIKDSCETLTCTWFSALSSINPYRLTNLILLVISHAVTSLISNSCISAAPGQWIFDRYWSISDKVRIIRFYHSDQFIHICFFEFN